MSEEKKTSVFVIDYLVREKLIGEEESSKLAVMLSSNDSQMRILAHFLIAERWKEKFSLPVIYKERIVKILENEQIPKKARVIEEQ